jgi:RNA polymerase sigma-70 factor (ECF subfamily)
MHDQVVTHDRVALLLKHRKELLGYLRKKLASPELAEDLLQDSLMKALRKAPDIRDEEKLLPWFYRILRNAVIDTYRSRGAAPGRVEIDVDLLEAPAEPSAADEQSLCECFRLLVPTLKPEYAAMIQRLELGTADPEAVAKELGITRNTLKVRRHRARQALRQRLEETCRTCAKHGCLDCTCQKGKKKALLDL